MNKLLQMYIDHPDLLIRELIEEWECEVEEAGREVISIYEHVRLSQEEYKRYAEEGKIPRGYIHRIFSL